MVTFAERSVRHRAIVPVSADAAKNGEWVSLADGARLTIDLQMGSITAASKVTVEKATAAAGTNNTEMPFSYYKYTAAGARGDRTDATASDGISTAAMGTTDNVAFSIDINPDALGTHTDGTPFTHVQIKLSSANNAAAAVYHLFPARYQPN